ncbi:hypothetical protein HMN09_01258800 [Mycena chlorophos]|uniref:Uncharacterized protein n=1 Tax=Mycena chlorophos TaxID=658473 RepID=A0A8H6S3Q2_MYCCL|nr:hypothetical protein HMN09_01258800 [Mycena chlorophos]
MTVPTENAIWPAATAAPRSAKRRRTEHLAASSKKMARQTVADQSEVNSAKTACEVDSGNDVVSCFPTESTVIAQHQWAAFVWNSNLPQFTQTDRVNIYLFHGQSSACNPPFVSHPKQEILKSKSSSFPTKSIPRASLGTSRRRLTTRWWGDRGTNYDGTNISYPFFWIMSRSDESIDDGIAQPQATFTAVQTTYADSVLAAMSSTSAAAAASSAAHAASIATPATTGSSLSIKSTATSEVQGATSSSNFPHWAIAVIVVLGFLAIATTCILAFFIIRRVRRRNAIESNRSSMGSSTPMMANTAHSAASPLLASAAIPARSTASHAQNAPSVVSPDGASTISRAGSGDAGPFSGADAAIMADAFRKALRKPDFADRPVEEGESPDTNPEATEEQLISRELADEGKDIRSVGSSRGVKVETLSDTGTHDTAQ